MRFRETGLTQLGKTFPAASPIITDYSVVRRRCVGDEALATANVSSEFLPEHGGLPLTLTEVGHQQPREGHQSCPGLSDRDACGTRSTGRFPATRTGQAVSSILRDQRLDDG